MYKINRNHQNFIYNNMSYQLLMNNIMANLHNIHLNHLHMKYHLSIMHNYYIMVQSSKSLKHTNYFSINIIMMYNQTYMNLLFQINYNFMV